MGEARPQGGKQGWHFEGVVVSHVLAFVLDPYFPLQLVSVWRPLFLQLFGSNKHFGFVIVFVKDAAVLEGVVTKV